VPKGCGEAPLAGRRSQAAEPSDFGVDFAAVLVAVFVVPALEDEPEDVDEEESVDELPESLEGAGMLVDPEPLPEPLPAPLRESVRESVR